MSSSDGNFYTKFRNEIAAGGATDTQQNQNNKLTSAVTALIVFGLLAWLGVKNVWAIRMNHHTRLMACSVAVSCDMIAGVKNVGCVSGFY